jgi:ABC-type nitrate/sulfonate/bicarbonate transport system ATPase subunit
MCNQLIESAEQGRIELRNLRGSETSPNILLLLAQVEALLQWRQVRRNPTRKADLPPDQAVHAQQKNMAELLGTVSL